MDDSYRNDRFHVRQVREAVTMQGRIIREVAGFYYVYSEETGETVQCRAKGIFRKKGLRPSVGDIVEYSLTNTEDVEGSVDEILPRKNSLGRPPVANVDQVLIVFAGKNPEPNFLLCDKFLIMLDEKEIPAALCFNKADITEEAAIGHFAEIYEKAGYPVFVTSAKLGEGKEALTEFLDGKLTAFAGPSGVGKSSLMNLISGTDAAETGEVSKKTGQGKQTTRASAIYVAGPSTYIIDPPGFGSLDLSGIEKEDLFLSFPEMTSLAGKCRFSSCAHLKEPGCAVKEAVEAGAIAKERYENYCSIYEELAAQRKY